MSAAILPPVTADGAPAWPSASIVIPTHDRAATLDRVLAALERELGRVGAEVEVVVVDDGSTDATRDLLARWRRRLPLACLHQANAGPARARNRGVAVASGEVVLFLGDDTVPWPGWLATHLEEQRVHRGEALAVLGYTSFPAASETPFQRWINEFGAQFGYLLLTRSDSLPFNFFYTSNVSLPRRVLLELGGFREDFPAAAWEDTELAYRAVALGLRLSYQPRARVVHEHRILLRTFRRRQRTAGRSAAIFAALHPELSGFLGVGEPRPAGLGGLASGLWLALEVALGEWLPGGVPAEVYERHFRRAYLAGLAEGLQGKGRR